MNIVNKKNLKIEEIVLNKLNQSLSVDINQSLYNLTILERNEFYLDIADSKNNKLICGIPLFEGSNLLQQYEYLEFGFMLFCKIDVDKIKLYFIHNI